MPLLHEAADMRMADVAEKPVTQRIAIARGFLTMGEEAFRRLSGGDLGKGDAISAAKLAGILAAKKTPELIPLCHPLPLDYVRITIDSLQDGRTVQVDAEVSARAKTGVEMEALQAVSGALLTIYDMCKPYDKEMVLKEMYLVRKTGGKSGDYERA